MLHLTETKRFHLNGELTEHDLWLKQKFERVYRYKVTIFFSDNEAPKITSPSEFFKLPGQAFEVELTASDPDPNGGLTFSAETGSPDIAVSNDGFLTWAATGNGDTVINVTVTDGCGASSTKRISLKIYNCSGMYW